MYFSGNTVYIATLDWGLGAIGIEYAHFHISSILVVLNCSVIDVDLCRLQ